jgi:hypothetical protein
MRAIHRPTSRAYCRVFLGRSRPRWPPEKEFTGLFLGGCDVVVDRFSGLFRHLELDWLAGLLLAMIARSIA